MALGNGDIVRCSIESAGSNGVLYINTLHYRVEGDAAMEGNEPTVADVCSKVFDKLGAAYRALLYGDRHLNRIVGRTEVQTWLGEVASAGEFVSGLAGTLIGGDGKLPNPLSAVIDLHSDVASRSSRGWQMLPGSVNSADMDGSGKWNSSGSYFPAVQAYAALLDDNIQHTVLAVNAWHLQPIIYSRTRRKRGVEPYYFSVKSAIAKQDPRWVNRRRTAP